MAVYLDANVFLFAAIGKEDDSRTVRAQALLHTIVQGKEQAITSVLTVDEFVLAWMKLKKDRAEAVTQGIRLHGLPNLSIIDVTPSISLHSLLLMQAYPTLKPRDALHAASCIAARTNKIISDDSDFDAIHELKRSKL